MVELQEEVRELKSLLGMPEPVTGDVNTLIQETPTSSEAADQPGNNSPNGTDKWGSPAVQKLSKNQSMVRFSMVRDKLRDVDRLQRQVDAVQIALSGMGIMGPLEVHAGQVCTGA